MKARRLSFAIVLSTLAACPAAPAFAGPDVAEDRPARDRGFDFGYGPNVAVGARQASLWNRLLSRFLPSSPTPYQAELAIRTLAAPDMRPPVTGNARVSAAGAFGPLLPWPIIPLHVALLPDGRVMSYGSDQKGNQSGLLFYDLWDPRVSYPQSHTVMPNTTGTDIFCNGLGLLPDGSLLMTGGDFTIQGTRGYSNADVNQFTPSLNALTRIGAMTYARWYPSDVPLPNGDHLIMGGRSNRDPSVPVQTPEYFSFANKTFTTLPNATLPTRFNWFYPRAFVVSDGSIFDLTEDGGMAKIWAAGMGGYQVMKPRAQASTIHLPAVMDGPSQIYGLRKLLASDATTATYAFQKVDASGPTPVITDLPSPPGAGRLWSSLTVLADGNLFLNGGSLTANVNTLTSYQSALFNTKTNAWSLGPVNATPRLYHSVALLMPDATVLTGGGGAPGPWREQNGEIYFPPYLYNPDGTPATRPVIVSAPPVVAPGAAFTLAMADASPIGAVNFVRIGAVTHSTNTQGRFLPASFTQDGATLTVSAPSNTNDFLSGYWMAFAFSATGTPSVAAIVYVPPIGQALH